MAEELPDAPWATAGKEELPDAPWVKSSQVLPHTVGEAVSSIAEPITSIPSTYQRMVGESVGQMKRGVGQIASGEPWEIAKGVGNVALGGVGYVGAPIAAPLHTIVGKPIEDVTGSPLAGQLAEAGASFALPMPKLPRGAAALPEEGPLGVTLSAGEKARDMGMRQAEKAAERGGDPHAVAWAAQREQQMQSAAERIAQGFDPFGSTIAETPKEAGRLVSHGVQRAAEIRKAAVDAAYKEARGLPGEIHADVFRDMSQGIKTDLSALEEPVIVNENTPFASQMIKAIDDKVSTLKMPQNKASPFGQPDPNAVVGINLNGVDQVRRSLSTARNDAFRSGNGADARAAKAVLKAFDDRIDQAVNNGMFTGDRQAINAWNDARAAHSDYASTFKGRDPVGKVVQKVIGDNVSDPMTPGKVMDHLIGSSTAGLNNQTKIGVANRFKSILGETSPEWIGVKQGMARHLMQAAEGEVTLGTGQTANRLAKFLNSDMAKAVYTPQEQAVLRSYADLMRRVTMPPGTYFPSAPGINPVLKAVMHQVAGAVGAGIGHFLVPGLGGEIGGYAAGVASAKIVDRAKANTIAKQLPLLGPQLQAWAKAQSRAQAIGNTTAQRAALAATVNLQKALDPLGIDLKAITQQGPAAAGAQDQGPQGHKEGGRINAQRQRFADGGAPDDPYDPLAASAGIAPAGPTPVGSAMLQHTIDLAAAPGRVAAGQQPQTPGMWSDVDEAQAQANARGLQVGAPEAATMMMGSGTPFAMAEHGALGVTGGRLPMPEKAYPLAPRGEWYGEANFEKTGGRMEMMTPDEFLQQSRPLKVDETSRENIDDLKRHMKEGKTLDPLQLYEGGKEDGRHRAIAAKELGIDQVPVINFRQKQAPPLYSAVERAVADAKTPQAPAQQWLGTLKNAPGVKPEELETLGVEDFLKGQKGPVSKQALAEHIAENKVDVQEVMKGGAETFDGEEAARRLAAGQRVYAEGGGFPMRPDAAILSTGRYTNIPDPVKFGQYTLPGGENYRELLLTLPTEPASLTKARADYERLSRPDTPSDQFNTAAQHYEQEVKAYQEAGGGRSKPQFVGSHWDEPNVLAHVRFDDRNIGGDKTLHMAEVQSDWHQKGRREGYADAATSKAYDDYLAGLKQRFRDDALARFKEVGMNDERALRQFDAHAAQMEPWQYARYFNEDAKLKQLWDAKVASEAGVPDAPFKTTWPELALKRMIRYAAENGYDRISWDTGLTNAERYDLSKQIKRLEYSPTHNLRAWSTEGKAVIDEAVPPEKLPDYIGKEAADKLMNAPTFESGAGRQVKYLEGLDLKVGGEGMKAFYDRMLPNVANKLVKKYGARVEQSELPQPFAFGEPHRGRTESTKSVHSIKITPELRDQALHRGFPMFSTGIPIPPHNTDKRETQGFAKGGAVNGKATKAAAEYKTKGHPPRICANCQMFRPPSFCTAVKGQISPQAVCKFFEAKKGRASGGRIDASHTVRTGANSSADGTVFVDPRIPAKFRKFLAVHETTEQKHMAGGYARAHKIATAAERKAVEASGMSWRHYTAEMDGYLDHIEHEKDTDPPKGKLHVSVGVALGHHRSGNK